jgi:hypothetical protein
MGRVLRANVTHFKQALGRNEDHLDRLSVAERLQIERELDERRTPGARLGRFTHTIIGAGASSTSSSKTRTTSSGQAPVKMGPSKTDLRVALKTLEITKSADVKAALVRGSGFQLVKKAYRRMNRKFHPDKFQGNPEKIAAANKVIATVGTAYNLLKKYHGK